MVASAAALTIMAKNPRYPKYAEINDKTKGIDWVHMSKGGILL